ncbi:MAG TPA: dihydroorotate dehydrogenase [Gemmatimonadales bacterium]|nr:dihydroorotate dehydrogenase [Gemmatimonadales bacterium]
MSGPALGRELFGTTFSNPIVLAAGTAGYGLELAGVSDLDRIGGIVCKAVSVEPREGNRPPRVAEFAGGMLNSVGLANPGLAHVVSHELPRLVASLSRCRILVNVVGFTTGEYGRVVAGLEAVEGIAAYELNLSCPNTSAGGVEFGADRECVRRIVEECRSLTRRGIAVKLSPALPDIADLALVARDAGADAITVVNTIPGLLYEGTATRVGHGNGGVSGPVLLPVGVLAVVRVLERTGGMPVIGVGGVRTASDARQYLRAGATLVGVGTAALADPRLPERIVRDLERGDG